MADGDNQTHPNRRTLNAYDSMLDSVASLLGKAKAMTDITDIVGADSTDQLPEDDYGVLPPGEYNLKVAEVDVRENSAQTGHYLKVQAQIVGPAREGAVVFENITLSHSKSPEAEEIGKTQLRNLAEACQVSDVLSKVERLEGGQFSARVTIDQWEGDDGETRESNGLKSFSAPTPSPAGPDDTEPGRSTGGTDDSGGGPSDPFDDDDVPF